MNEVIPVIAIDGPSASGKGTVAQQVARRLGFHFLDSGALYRLVALASFAGAGQRGQQSESELATLARNLDACFDGERIVLENKDVTDALREEACGRQASVVAALPAVRTALLARQRAFRRVPGLVADGRDMGTVVFPDAMLKVFLTASAGERARRRYKQLIEKGIDANLPSLLRDLEERDRRDMVRATAPLVAAVDALTVDSSNLGADQVVELVLGEWRKKQDRVL